MRVLWFPMSNLRAASARTRSHAIVAELRQRGVDVRLCGHPRWPRWPNRIRKFLDLARQLPFADVVVFQKTAHWTTYAALSLAHSLGKRVVFDIDDAAHLWDEGAWVKRFFREADIIVAGSHALIDVAENFGARETIWIPTTVELSRYPPHQPRDPAAPFVIGWIGTPANLPVLDIVREPLAQLARERRVVLRVVTDVRNLQLEAPEGVELQTVAWKLEEAGAQVAAFDVGIMPLPDSEAARCKCAFKALEFMACGVPAVVSDVGENQILVRHRFNGMRARTTEEWLQALSVLASQPQLRAQLGQEGRRTVVETYTTEQAAASWLRLLERQVDRPAWAARPAQQARGE